MSLPDKERAAAAPAHGDRSAYRAVYETAQGILADHVIAGRSILPGASMVDLALAAAQARQLPCHALKDVFICRPALARDRLAIEVRWSNSSAFKIDDGRNLLCIGRVEEREVAPRANALVFDVAARGEAIEPRTLYADLDRLGYRYGPGLQVMQSVVRLADGMLFTLSAGRHSDCRSRIMNPALLDGVIQAVFCVLQHSGRPIRSGGLLVPMGIRRLSIHGELAGKCFVRVGESALMRRADDVLADVQIRNERGRPLMRIEGLLLKYVPRDFLDKFDVAAGPS